MSIARTASAIIGNLNRFGAWVFIAALVLSAGDGGWLGPAPS